MPKTKNWTVEQLKTAALCSTSIRQILKKLNLVPAGGNYDQIKKYLDKYNIDTTHFKGKAWNKGLKGIGKHIIPLDHILVSDSKYQSYKLKKRLYESGYKLPQCEECGWAKMTSNGRIPLELDHINGNKHDNRLENLRILCPNCHSLKDTHRGLNKNARML